ncbi:MAG: hypothetical protein ACI4QT_08070 [Kiritimatiellia bacterium]
MKSIKIILGAVGGVTAVAVIGIGVFAFLRSQAATEARGTMQQQANQLRKLYEKDVFPSQENIETAQKNRDETYRFVRALRDEMKRGMIPVDRKKTPGDFSNIRMATISSLLEDAPIGTGDAKVVDNSQATPFQFGFDRYKDGIPAEKRDVPRLLTQLRMMDKLVRVLYDSGIVSLEAVAREEFEGGSPASVDAASEAPRVRGRGGRARGARAAAALAVTKPVLPAGAPEDLTCERFMFRFQTRESGLIAALNKLNEMRPFAVVSDLAFEKLGEDVVFPDEQKETAASESAKGAASSRPARSPRGAAVPAAAEATAPAIRERPAPRTARLVSGPLRERPVRVTLTVDIYSILPPVRQGSDEREED